MQKYDNGLFDTLDDYFVAIDSRINVPDLQEYIAYLCRDDDWFTVFCLSTNIIQFAMWIDRCYALDAEYYGKAKTDSDYEIDESVYPPEFDQYWSIIKRSAADVHELGHRVDWIVKQVVQFMKDKDVTFPIIITLA